MQPKTQRSAGGDGEELRLPAGLKLKPAVSLEELQADVEHDPDGADDFVALIRALRREFPRPIAL